MSVADLAAVPVCLGLTAAILLPLSGYTSGGRFIKTVGISAILLAAAALALGLVLPDYRGIPGFAMWTGNVSALAILVACGLSIIITKRAVSRASRGEPYRF
jgi:hypothetical protein